MAKFKITKAGTGAIEEVVADDFEETSGGNYRFYNEGGDTVMSIKMIVVEKVERV